jgi:hypothetical protein
MRMHVYVSVCIYSYVSMNMNRYVNICIFTYIHRHIAGLQNINSSLLASHRNGSTGNLSTSSWGGSYDVGDSTHVYKVYNDADNNSVISSNAPDIDDNLVIYIKLYLCIYTYIYMYLRIIGI